MQIHEIPREELMVTDEQVFAAFDYSYPGLEPVKKALDAGDTAQAKALLVRHMEQRKNPVFLYDYRELPLTPIDTDSCPYSFQSSLGLGGSLKDFCLFVGRQMMKHIYVLPGRSRQMIDLGANWENMIHFNYLEDMGKRHRRSLNMIVRGQFFESLCVLYHETGDRKVLDFFEEFLQVYWNTYPLSVVNTDCSASRFQLTEDRDVMSAGWLAIVYTSLFYTRVPYEISVESAFDILKRIWFLGIQFLRFEQDHYRPYNHHMWERGLVPFILAVLFPEIPDFVSMKSWGAANVSRHVKDDFKPCGGYSEHSISYWSGAAVGEMLYRGIYLARLNGETLLDDDAASRIWNTFHVLAMITSPGDTFPSLGDNGNTMQNPILTVGERVSDHWECREILKIRLGNASGQDPLPALDFCDHDAGYVCAKSGYSPDSNYVLMSAKVDCGYSGHNHMDMLSLFLTMKGEEFIGEPYSGLMYHNVRMASEIRGYMYNMPSHNTVLCYGQPVAPNRMYANKWGVMRPSSPVVESWSRPEGFYASAYHDGYTFCRHTRELLFCRDRGLIVADHILRGNRTEDPHIQRWNFMPGVHLTVSGPDALTAEKNGVRLLLLWTGAPHEITLSRPDVLTPEMIPSAEDLAEIADIRFWANADQSAENATVSLYLLILDVTGRDVDDAGTEALGRELQALAGRLREPESLANFPRI